MNEKGSNFSKRFVRYQLKQLQWSLERMHKEGFQSVYILNGEEEVQNIEIVRTPMPSNQKSEKGPLDIIGDVHGCYEELCNLLSKLGYRLNKKKHTAFHPQNRKAVFLGDICDRGPKNMDVLRLVMNMRLQRKAYCVMGNHDMKLLRKLRGSKVRLNHGLERTWRQLQKEPNEFAETVENFIDSLVGHYVFDHGKLVVVHAGLKEQYHGRDSDKIQEFCMYGETTGEIDEYGLPVRLKWANDYQGQALVVYGHTPSLEVQMVGNAICVDTGCVFGGKLTAYQYPERKICQVKAKKEYYRPAKPIE